VVSEEQAAYNIGRKYTKEEGRTILSGLRTGKPRNWRPMSDAEYEARYDPEGARQKLILAALDRIAFALKQLAQTDLPVPPNPEPYSRPAPTQSRGPVEI